MTVHWNISGDTGKIQHTSTFILNTFIKIYNSLHKTNTAPLLYDNLVLGIFKKVFMKTRAVFIIYTFLALFETDFTLVHFSYMLNVFLI